MKENPVGRPLRKKFFGELAGEGSQITVLANIGGSDAIMHIVEQKGTGKYLVSDGTTTALVKLVDKSDPAAGEASLTVSPHGGGTEYARVLLTNDVKTFSGNTYKWVLGSTSATGQAQISSEGSPAPVFSTAVPTISGTTTSGQTLTATAGSVTNGIGTVSRTYRWLADGENITGATAATLVLAAGHVGKKISVRVTTKTTSGQQDIKTSIETAVVAAA